MCFEHASDHVAWEGLLCGVVGEVGAVVFDQAFEDGAEPEVPVAVFERGSGVLSELSGLFLSFSLPREYLRLEGGDGEH